MKLKICPEKGLSLPVRSLLKVTWARLLFQLWMPLCWSSGKSWTFPSRMCFGLEGPLQSMGYLRWRSSLFSWVDLFFWLRDASSPSHWCAICHLDMVGLHACISWKVKDLFWYFLISVSSFIKMSQWVQKALRVLVSMAAHKQGKKDRTCGNSVWD